ncbi:MAG: hypothetical protein M1313_00930 [Nitrospirae bacterium]|nr:hypothetical protein [Nitrospirota bacterium]
METMERLLDKARTIGERAWIDAVPDPTPEGFLHWKKDLLAYFGCATDNFLSENHLETLSDEMRESMKVGVMQLVMSQPYVEAPLQPMEPTPRETEIRIIDEVFNELKTIPHHCTH